MTKEEIIDSIARLNSETWRDREEVRTEIGKLLSELKKALEQQPSEDVMAIHTQGLDEGIRCAMCTNSMKSDTGCDGGCRVDEDMYKKVMDTIRNQIVPPVMPTFPKDTTNGDMIKAMFPKIEIYTDVINEIVDVEICEDSSELRCSIDWWNALYKRGNEDGSN